jgi:hypothetical protein
LQKPRGATEKHMVLQVHLRKNFMAARKPDRTKPIDAPAPSEKRTGPQGRQAASPDFRHSFLWPGVRFPRGARG